MAETTYAEIKGEVPAAMENDQPVKGKLTIFLGAAAGVGKRSHRAEQTQNEEQRQGSQK